MFVIHDPVVCTWLIGLALAAFLILTVRLHGSGTAFSPAVTKELKGAAILMVIFSHIGYFLSNDQRFLWPLSTMAGVGVNLFLFLSAYGLSTSNMKYHLSILGWYEKHLLKLFIPLWIAVITISLMDLLILRRHYPLHYILQALIGYFPRADVHFDLDSVLWYFSLILFYYLLFPLLFFRKHLWATAILLFYASIVLVHWGNHLVTSDVLKLYKLHDIAFPLGVLVAWASSNAMTNKVIHHVKASLGRNLLKEPRDFVPYWAFRSLRYLLILGLTLAIGYFAIHSAVGESTQEEEFVSVCTTLLIVLLFIIKKVEFRFLSMLGALSYEVYLFHWPLLSRYDPLYYYVPAWLATIASLGVIIIIAWILTTAYERLRLSNQLSTKLRD